MFFLSKSRIWTSLCYYCDVWVGTPKCYLKLLDKLQKEILWTVGRTLATYFERSTRFQYLVSLSLLLVQRCFLNLFLVLITLNDLMDIPRVCNMSTSLTSASLQVIYLMIYIFGKFKQTKYYWNQLLYWQSYLQKGKILRKSQ